MFFRPVGAAAVLGGLALASSACTVSSDEPVAELNQAILGGQLADAPDSPTLLLSNSMGLCSAILIAPNLVATARHCAAALTPGGVTCSPQATLEPNSVGGELGADSDPSSLAFYTSAHVGANNPDAYGKQILSTGAPTICADDISFVVLDRPVQGVTPVPIRLDTLTVIYESVSVWGYGLSEEASTHSVLRVRPDAEILAIGPDTAPQQVQPAPVRSVLLGPGSVGCAGDSGGPILSNATGALIGLVSMGIDLRTGGTCQASNQATTTGPRLAEYQQLALQAFAAAGATPIPEPGTGLPDDASDDAATPDGDVDETDAPSEAGDSTTDATAVGDASFGDASAPDGSQETPSGGGCAVAYRRTLPERPWVWIGMGVAMMLAMRRSHGGRKGPTAVWRPMWRRLPRYCGPGGQCGGGCTCDTEASQCGERTRSEPMSRTIAAK